MYTDKSIWAATLHHSSGHHSSRIYVIRIVDWMDGWTFITWSRFKNKSSSFNFHWEKKIKGIDGLQINFLSQNTLFLFYKKLKMNLLKIRGWNWFFWCVSVKCFGFRQCQLARCLLWKMRTAALLSLLSHTRHDFAIFVSCFFILSRFITVVFCIFQYSIWKWINCSRFFVVFFFFFLPPFTHFPVFTFDSFLNQLSFCHQIYFTRKARCVIFPEVFLFKVCLFLLTWHHAWENILWSYLLYSRTLFHISSSVLWHWILLWRRVWCQPFSFFSFVHDLVFCLWK